MNNKFKIYPEINFGVSKLSEGKKSIQELLEIAEEFRSHSDFERVHYQLTDLRNCSFDFNPDKIQEMISLMEKYKHKDKQQIGVYLVDKPLTTAYVSIFFKKLGENRELCSTIQGAYNKLNLPVSYEEFEELINI